MPEIQKELSGRQWVDRFPGSKSLDDLADPFRSKAKGFVGALLDAGCGVAISSTLRPPQRAWLMHYSAAIAQNVIAPENVPPNTGINIEWVYRVGGQIDRPQSRSAALQMVQSYEIDPTSPLPALQSRHTEGCAIDMTISWNNTLAIRAANGIIQSMSDGPRSGLNPLLQQVGHGYGVVKAVFTDDPHWSSDGH